MNAWVWLSRNDRWIPALIVAGFLITVAANGTMIWFALGTWSGLTTDQAYNQGLAYNETLAGAQASDALGWEVDISVADDGQAQTAELVVKDAVGAPVDGASIYGLFVRPTHEGFDFETVFRQVGAGRYLAEFDAPLDGQWDLRVEIVHANNVYRTAKRVLFSP